MGPQLPMSGDVPSNCNMENTLNPSDLLPKDMNSEWSDVNPASNDLKNVNIALKKPVFASSSNTNGLPVLSVTDGTTTIRNWPNLFSVLTNNRSIEFIEVDLGASFAISSVRLIQQPGHTSNTSIDRISNTRIQINSSTSGTPGAGAFTIKSGAITSDNTTQTSGYTGRYIRIMPAVNTGDGYLPVSQIIVYDSKNINIALDKPAYATSTLVGILPVSCVTDGSTFIRFWPNLHCTLTPNRNTEFIEIDLGASYAISSIRIITMI
jgi:hypothetical protein